MKNMITISELFQGLQSQMSAKLNTNRKHILHPVSKGDSLENGWIEWLNEYLPNRYKVTKAHVIDHTGAMSDQIDIVIYDNQYSPFIFRQDGISFIPAESVYAVFEVKPEINKGYWEYAGKKIQSVRTLTRTSAQIHDFKGVNQPKVLKPILGGFIALHSSWQNPLGTSFETAVKKLSADEQINLGCILEAGSFSVDYSDPAAPAITRSDKDEALIFFFLKLLDLLQKLATVPAIEIPKYASSLKSF